MWDLDQIVRQNNQAALDYMMRGRTVTEAQTPKPEAWALSLLAEKLKVGPPLLEAIINSFENMDTLEQFLRIIRELLPEHEREILSEPANRRLYRFGYLFGKKYYPLPLNTECGMGDFVGGMPVELLAMSYSAYHELGFRPGYLLLLSLVVYPYEGDERDEEDDPVPFDPINLPARTYKPSARDIDWLRGLVESLAVDGEWIAPMGFSVVKVADNKIELREAEDTPQVKETIRRTLLIAERAGIAAEFPRNGRTYQEKLNGARVPLLDAVQRIIGEETARLIPAEGWQPADLHCWTDNTPYDGVGHFASWACSDTGCVVLDSNYDDCEFIEGYGEPIFKWTKRNVDILTEQWPRVQEYRKKVDHAVEWLEADPPRRFRELMDFILSKIPRKEPAAAKTKAYYDPMDHLCPLDQLGQEEEEDDGETNISEITPEQFVAGIDIARL